MLIEILGTGCSKCFSLERHVRKAIEKIGAEAEIKRVEDINEIIERGVINVPGLFINGELISTGRVLGVKDLMKIIVEKR